MAISTNYSFSRLCQPLFRSNHMHNSIIFIKHINQFNPKFFTVSWQRIQLCLWNFIFNIHSVSHNCWRIVIHCSKCQVRSSNLSPCNSQSWKRLWRSNFMNQVQINIQKLCFPRFSRNHMFFPNFIKQSFWFFRFIFNFWHFFSSDFLSKFFIYIFLIY